MTASRLLLAPAVAIVILFGTFAFAQESSPSQDVDQVTAEAQTTPEQPLAPVDRPVYTAIQNFKEEIAKAGLHFAIEDTAFYQHTTGGIEPNQALVNTLDLFATWKIFRSQDGKDFGGIGFLGESRQNPLDHNFTEVTNSLGTLWSPNDSSSDDYNKIAQLWWGMKLIDGRLGFQIGKIDPGSIVDGNRFAGSGNTQFFSQPFVKDVARSFPDNGIGLQARGEITDQLYVHYMMSDSDAISTHSPFTTINGHWIYAGEIGWKPVIGKLGQGIYRVMIYDRDAATANEMGWSLSADQNITDNYGVFLRYGGNDGKINAIKEFVSTGFSFLAPFHRKNDEAGVGVSYTHPTSNTLRDEYSSEVYYRVQMTEGFELSASAQLIVDPAASTQDVSGVFGVRARLLY
jgi:porin